MRLDLRLDDVRIEISDSDHGHEVRPIPRVVKRAELLGRGGHDARLRSDRQTLGVSRALECDWKPLLKHSVARAFSAAPLFANYSALVRDFRRVEDLAVGPVLQDRECLIHDSRGIGGNREDIDGLVEAGIGIEVGAESNTDRLEVLDEIVLGEVLRSVEGSVLDEVSQAQLVGRLENRSRIYDEPELGTLFRPCILADVVAKAV